jgi:hypothetical protein
VCAAGAVAGIVVGTASGQADLPPVAGVRERSGQLLVRPVQESQWVARGHNGNKLAAEARSLIAERTIRVLPITDIHVITATPGETEPDDCAALMATGYFEFAEPDWVVYPLSEPETRPDDPSIRSQWHLDRVRAPLAWNGYTGDGSIVCAFVDTGVDLTHPDLAPLLVPGFNSVSNTPQASGGLVADINGHGTAVAGSAVAMGNNNSGGSGVCWSARIMPIRATNLSSGSAFLSNVLYGASWAAFNGAKIVSVSYAGVESSSVESTGAAIKNNYGGLLVWAAGNSSSYITVDHPSTTVVGATDWNDVLAWDTSYGPGIDVMSPGVQVLVPAMGGGYAYRSGSSFAAPIAAGVLALAWSSAPTLTPDQAMSVLYRSSMPLEPVHPQNSTGWGRVDARRALEYARGVATPKAAEVLPAASIPPSVMSGLRARYYAMPGATVLPTTFSACALAESVIPRINFSGTSGFPGCPLASGFGVSIQGFIEIHTTGVYTLSLSSKDGSRLTIDGRRLIVNDGLHATRFRSGSVWLERGMHRLECDYFSSTAQPHLVLTIRGEQLGEVVVPASRFSFDTTVQAAAETWP